MSLTPSMRAALIFIDAHLTRTGGIAPTYDQIKDHLGIRSKSGIWRLVKALTERGYIRALPHKARSLEIIRMPGEQGQRFSAMPTTRAEIEAELRELERLTDMRIEALDMIDAAVEAIAHEDEDAEPDPLEASHVPARSDFLYAEMI